MGFKVISTDINDFNLEVPSEWTVTSQNGYVSATANGEAGDSSNVSVMSSVLNAELAESRIATMMIDPRDGMDKAAVDSLLCYGANQSCAEILLHAAPVFICDEFDSRILRADADTGIYSIWCEDQTIFHTEERAKLTVNPQESFAYTKVFAGY